ncbi:hypothetical protein DNTS_021710 [Danionella cerebrum]|uniref:Biotinidase n=1 Tax=Danionella cerebrum TaxID=2873325 RepID=A0A553P5D2_9TELE|nr:hypothetical protein DNTS_021710 [Danionella translucida]
MALRGPQMLLLTGCVLCFNGLTTAEATGHPSYVAAVYEHRVLLNPRPWVPLNRSSALEHMEQNLRVFEDQSARAAQQGAQIIVFPEDAIHGFNFTRTSISGYLQDVPDPQKVTWSPCADPQRFPNTEVLQRLSCMARKNHIFVVANMASRHICKQTADPNCPVDGQYQFNTNVIFDDKGFIVGQYHKQNLYFEAAFNTPPKMEYVTFSTPFAGRFGVFTCFDILFQDPAVTLVKDLGVRQVVYPTAWMNQLPLLAAVQFQRSFAYAIGITLLAANIRSVEMSITGSGIFTPWDSLIHHDPKGNSGKLLVRRVPVLDPLFIDNKEGETFKLVPFLGFPKRESEISWGLSSLSTNFNADCPPVSFTSIMMYDNFTLIPLHGSEGNVSVCSGSLCCHLLFQRNERHEFYALGVFDGLHVVHGTYYLEVCALVKCTGDEHTLSGCGGETEHAQTLMDFRMHGTFRTRHVFPGILGSGVVLEIPDHSGWEEAGFYMSRRGMSVGLVTAVLMERIKKILPQMSKGNKAF